MNAIIFLMTLGSALLALSLKNIYVNRPRSYSSYIHRQRYIAPNIQWGNDNANPPPPRLSNLTEAKDKLYVLILDSEFKEDRFQCLVKKQWIEPFLKEPFVDAVEIYSRNSWVNKECNLSSIVTPKLPKKYSMTNPSSWILSNALKMFLERSDSGWLLLIGDAAYINVEKFKKFFSAFKDERDPLYSSFASGGCIDQRYFFQMFIIESGVIFSRKAIESVFNERYVSKWDITYQIGLNADEALSQIMTENYLSPKSKANDQFLGREFLSSEDFVSLENISSIYKKNKSSTENIDHIVRNMIPRCEIPYKYFSVSPGMQGLCSRRITSFTDLIIWSASGQNKTKFEFLSNADDILNNLPKSVGYFWNPDKPQLCSIPKKPI